MKFPLSYLFSFFSKEENQEISNLKESSALKKNETIFNSNEPSLPDINEPFSKKVNSLCQAIEYYTPKEEKTKSLLEYNNQLKNCLNKTAYNKNLIFALATQCQKELMRLKVEMPENWYNKIKPFTKVFIKPSSYPSRSIKK